MLRLAGWLWFMVASVTAEKTLYGKLGDEVNLKPDPDSVTNKINSITWKVGPDIAAQSERGLIDYYRHFKERGNLDSLTGEMKITGLLFNDSNVYTPEIDYRPGTPTRLIVISVVPEPTIDKFCPEGKSECYLICDGNTTGAEPVTYGWMLDNNVVANFDERKYNITEESSEIKEFTCTMTNPVSERSSDPFLNTSPTKLDRKIITGVIVLFSLLLIVMLPVVFHRIRTGEWFYEKESMPWEKDFWRKQQAGITESNGTATSPPKVEEELLMTEN